MPRIHDISPLLSPRIAVWPGDVPYARRVALAMAEGDHLDLSSLHTTVHVGAHADAPSHYAADGEGIDRVALEPYLGPCQVVRVSVARGARILPSDVTVPLTAPRVLFHTGTCPDPDRFNEDFASLSPELVHWLHGQGCVLVGLDTPSVDPFASKALESHQALRTTGLRNLEGLVLEAVPPGDYLLVALPLRLEGADASPVRAVLVEGVLPGLWVS
ncbi:MAG: cyclase family protein [Holophagaceae bacterium]|nr:cyclase family protein [Holophagaceae bacterium]